MKEPVSFHYVSLQGHKEQFQYGQTVFQSDSLAMTYVNKNIYKQVHFTGAISHIHKVDIL
jgi:hypothetical protein